MNAIVIFLCGLVAGVGLAALAGSVLRGARPRRSLADPTDATRVRLRLVWPGDDGLDGRAGDVDESDFI